MPIKRTGSTRQPARRRWLQALTTCAAAGAVVLGLAAQPAAAIELIVWQAHGNDSGELEYWGNASAVGRVTVCDNEADGHGVYVQLMSEAGESLSWTDSGGSDGVCRTDDSYFAVNFIRWFRVCERINNWPDNCTDKVNITKGD
ncbi:hypothetical protein [Streptomyces sp. A012304]|uniref:hypothetical protein n=1 Tax=Streptomyces sp. A012304 TaxID=375446 RepID=UPI0022305AF9|nr:hypothetical protein [Streptomyces sp. A012304]GKQ40314.1 hypothetical protein ALMP_68400 [Streptomyces sp. A012304]